MSTTRSTEAARAGVDELRARVPFPCRYVAEPEPGISAARNAGLEMALREDFAFMATVDDDMRVEPDWLRELLAVAVDTDADAVIGRRGVDYQGKMAWWVKGAWRLDSHAPGDREPLGQGHTGSSLVRLARVRELALRFEQGLGRSGGEDTLFFDEILRAGGRILYSSESVSHEVFGPERARVRWWLARWYRTGNTTGLVMLAGDGGARARVLLAGAARVLLGAGGTVCSLPWLLIGRATGMRAVRMLCRGAGYIAAGTGLRYEEYARDARRD